MIHAATDPRAQLESGLTPDLRRQLFRLSGQHFLNTARLIATAVDRDLVTALTFLSISRANVRDLTVDRARALTYSAALAIPPDEERKPVSVYAVAKELGLPYETIRRHAQKLRTAGVVETVEGGGLIIPARAYALPDILAAVAQYSQGCRDFVQAAGRAGIAPPGLADPPQGDVSRQVVRLGIEHFLETLTAMARIINAEPITAVVMRCISLFNVNHVTDDPGLAAAYASLGASPPSDDQRRPISVYAISKALMLPYETTRRHVQRLMDQGLVKKVTGGLIVPAAVVLRPDVAAGMAQSADQAYAYLANLAAYGVTAEPATAD